MGTTLLYNWNFVFDKKEGGVLVDRANLALDWNYSRRIGSGNSTCLTDRKFPNNISNIYCLRNFLCHPKNFKFQISNFKFKTLETVCYLLFAISNFLYFFHDYLAHYPRMYSGEWQYGYKDSIEYVQSVQDNYSKIYATSDLGRPYIYYLFYTKTDPRLFRKNNVVKRDVFGFVNIERFGKYDFLNKKKKADNKNDKALFVQTPLNVPSKS